MSKNLASTSTVNASSNWLALKKKLPTPTTSKPARYKHPSNSRDSNPRKRQKIAPSLSPEPVARSSYASRAIAVAGPSKSSPKNADLKNGESLAALRTMISGKAEYTDSQKLPGKYLALDCEMVGVGIDGAESSLARVSLVNYYGAIQLDTFVRQSERVVDYRTQFSGVRESDMIKAIPFKTVQKQVAELLKDRILIGHAVHNDLKSLLLSHPRPQTRDTQYYAGKTKVVKTNRVALRNLVKQELDVVIQAGEHSSVTDARATMAVFRLHRKEWEKGMVGTSEQKGKKRKREDVDEDEGALEQEKGIDTEKTKVEFPGGGRKGVSSGLGTVVRRHGKSVDSPRTGGEMPKTKTKWWKEILSKEKVSNVSPS